MSSSLLTFLQRRHAKTLKSIRLEECFLESPSHDAARRPPGDGSALVGQLQECSSSTGKVQLYQGGQDNGHCAQHNVLEATSSSEQGEKKDKAAMNQELEPAGPKETARSDDLLPKHSGRLPARGVGFVRAFDEPRLESFLLACPQIRHVRLRHCCQFGRGIVTRLVRGLPLLDYLMLDRCDLLNGDYDKVSMGEYHPLQYVQVGRSPLH